MADLKLTLQIPRDHPSYAGHFPDQALVPGVMLLDLVLQAVDAHPLLWPGSAGAPFEIAVCKFLQPVWPGATLQLSLIAGASPGTINFQLAQNAQPVASGSLRSKGRA